MFALASNSIPTIQSYEAARDYFDSAKETRYAKGNERELGGGRGSRLIVRDGDDYRFRYHSTDCVIYHANGDITVEGYDSRSTDTFVGKLTPRYFSPEFCKGLGYILWVQGPMLDPAAAPHGEYGCVVTDYGYHVSRATRFAPRGQGVGYAPADPANLTRMRLSVVDRKAMAAARKDWRIADFKTWWAAVKVQGDLIGTHRFARETVGKVPSLSSHTSGWIKEQLLAATPHAYLSLVAASEVRKGFGHHHDGTSTFSPVSQVETVMRAVENVHTEVEVDRLTAKSQMLQATRL